MDLAVPVTSMTVAAVLCCGLVAGLLFAFAVVVMPGLRPLSDADFIRTFQTIDAVIQRRAPLFVAVWAASAVLPVAAAGTSLASAGGPGTLLLTAAAAVMLLGVHLPTLAVNVPANNRLQAVDVRTFDGAAVARARREFEPTWNRWNAVRAAAAAAAVLLLAIALS